MTAISTPTYQLVRDLIRSDIVEGIWPLGGHMTMADLTRRYSVSANPIREALQQLQGEGVIDLRMNRGAVVPNVDARYIDNIYKLRTAVQVMLAREAAQRITPAAASKLRELNELHEVAVANGDTAACVRCNRDLHQFMDKLADNPPAMEVLASRLCLVDAFRRSVGFGVGRLDKVVAQHRRLVKAISRGDGESAARAAQEHTESARQDLMVMLQRRKA